MVNETQPPQRFGFLPWFYAVWKGTTAIVLVVGGCIPTVFLGWDTMLPSGKMVAVSGLIVSAWKAADMAVRETVKRLMEGKPPADVPKNGNGGTQHIIKADVGK